MEKTPRQLGEELQQKMLNTTLGTVRHRLNINIKF